MPICNICRTRIRLAYRGVRAYRCSKCGSTVCKEHYERDRKLCFECAGKSFSLKRKSFIKTGQKDEGQD
ncbi:MAG: hypothetical protein KAI64_02600 [Thermoplasmata archaeon]|nr:hypothetical protein [Thermoplasmata archaeon]